uniref:Uncharacterized protein n=1 Tax=Cannabis sativa TaxID=3483 RepID=A0A803QRB7_CANSA
VTKVTWHVSTFGLGTWFKSGVGSGSPRVLCLLQDLSRLLVSCDTIVFWPQFQPQLGLRLGL